MPLREQGVRRTSGANEHLKYQRWKKKYYPYFKLLITYVIPFGITVNNNFSLPHRGNNIIYMKTQLMRFKALSRLI